MNRLSIKTKDVSWRGAVKNVYVFGILAAIILIFTIINPSIFIQFVNSFANFHIRISVVAFRLNNSCSTCLVIIGSDVFIIGIIANTLNLFGANTAWQPIIKGLVIVGAILFQRYAMGLRDRLRLRLE